MARHQGSLMLERVDREANAALSPSSTRPPGVS